MGLLFFTQIRQGNNARENIYGAEADCKNKCGEQHGKELAHDFREKQIAQFSQQRQR